MLAVPGKVAESLGDQRHRAGGAHDGACAGGRGEAALDLTRRGTRLVASSISGKWRWQLLKPLSV